MRGCHIESLFLPLFNNFLFTLIFKLTKYRVSHKEMQWFPTVTVIPGKLAAPSSIMLAAPTVFFLIEKNPNQAAPERKLRSPKMHIEIDLKRTSKKLKMAVFGQARSINNRKSEKFEVLFSSLGCLNQINNLTPSTKAWKSYLLCSLSFLARGTQCYPHEWRDITTAN